MPGIRFEAGGRPRTSRSRRSWSRRPCWPSRCRALAGARSLAGRDVLQALATSLAIAVPAGLLAVGAAFGLAALMRRLRLVGGQPRAADAVGLMGLLALVLPPVALSAGLFVVLRPIADPFAVAAPLIVVVNGLMALLRAAPDRASALSRPNATAASPRALASRGWPASESSIGRWCAGPPSSP